MRKTRAQHVHCECMQKGHSREDCPHDKDGNHVEAGTCCCQHTSKCTCAAKKDHLQAVPEEETQAIQPNQTLKRLSNHNSHGSKPTVFTNGHHKPVHKFNDSHNQFGSPYKIPSRSHTVHDQQDAAQRSSDSLPLPLTNMTTKPQLESPLHSIMNTDATRQVRSEHNSPMLAPALLAPSNFDIPPFNPALDYSSFSNRPERLTQSGLGQLDEIPRDWFMSYEEAQQYQPPKWANDGFSDSNDSNAGIIRTGQFNLNQQPSPISTYDPFTQFAFLNNASNASSGEVSEVEEFSPANPRPSVLRSFSQEPSNDLSSNGGDEMSSDQYRHSSASSYYGTPHAALLASEKLGNLGIDDFIKQAEDETRKMQMQNRQFRIMQTNSIAYRDGLRRPPAPHQPDAGSAVASPPNLLHPLTVYEAQEYAHMNDGPSVQPVTKPAMPTTSMAQDPAWSMAPDLSDPMLSLDGDAQEDEDWVR
ncbi:hypothetical protein DV736_g734, partial [Chaetothyriales sp. CBS 134916]